MKKYFIAIGVLLLPAVLWAAGVGISTWTKYSGAIADGDYIAMTDVSDTTGSSDGTSKAATAAQLKTYVLAEAVNLTVDGTTIEQSGTAPDYTIGVGSIPITKITDSTTEELGLGKVQLGHASDTTIERTGAGVVTVEGVTVTRTIVSGSATFNPGSINSAACSSAVDGGTATGVATTDVIDWGFSGTPIAVTGYVPLATGGVYIVAYPTADHVNFIACNNTAGAIDPGSVTLNWAVRR